jgi:hypothetical protein
LNDGTYPAVEAIARWADEEVSSTRSSMINYNLAIASDFVDRPAVFYRHP